MMQLPEQIRILDRLSGGFQRAQILYTALEGGIFPQLEEPRDAEEMADLLGWDARGTRMLLDGLAAIGIVEKQNGRWRNTEIASNCLIPGAPYDQTHILKHKAYGRNAWMRLPEAVRTGDKVGSEDRSGEELRAFICGMNDIAKESARGMLEVLDFSVYRHLLDAGGGPGTYSITLLQENPDLRATVFDLPPVIEIGREQVEKAGLTDRVDFRAGDLTRDSLGEGYDLVLLSNIIHSFGPEKNRELVRKCFDALDPGGLLIIKDFLVDPGRTGPAFSLIFALHMLVNTGEGDTYTAEEVQSWTDAAGFQGGRCADLSPQTRLWLARKPER
jgi:SAM-dependent methyltransferase